MRHIKRRWRSDCAPLTCLNGCPAAPRSGVGRSIILFFFLHDNCFQATSRLPSAADARAPGPDLCVNRGFSATRSDPSEVVWCCGPVARLVVTRSSRRRRNAEDPMHCRAAAAAKKDPNRRGEACRAPGRHNYWRTPRRKRRPTRSPLLPSSSRGGAAPVCCCCLLGAVCGGAWFPGRHIAGNTADSSALLQLPLLQHRRRLRCPRKRTAEEAAALPSEEVRICKRHLTLAATTSSIRPRLGPCCRRSFPLFPPEG